MSSIRAQYGPNITSTHLSGDLNENVKQLLLHQVKREVIVLGEFNSGSLNVGAASLLKNKGPSNTNDVCVVNPLCSISSDK